MRASSCPPHTTADESLENEAEIARLRYQLAHDGAVPDPEFSIINAHEHVFDRTQGARYLKAAKKAGIQQTIMVASSSLTLYGSGYEQHEGMAENFLEILAFSKAHPDEIIPFTTLDPAGTPEKLRQLKAHVKLGARGLKLYSGHSTFHTVSLDSREMLPVYQYAEETGLPVLWHVNVRKFGAEFRRVMDAYPRLNVVVPHYGVSFAKATEKDFENLRDLLSRYPNLMFDTSLGTRQILVGGLHQISKKRDQWRVLVESHPDRFVMGTDMVVTGNREKTTAWMFEVIMACRDQLEQEVMMTALAAAHSKYSLPGFEPRGRFRGLHLEKSTLKKVYEENPRRWLGLHQPPAQP